MRRAFTLIELLVVIAIIAVLAAILFPVFAQAKLAAKKAQGLAQMKQVGTALQLYANDFDDGLPTWNRCLALIPPATSTADAVGRNCPGETTATASARPQYFWDALLEPYAKSGRPAQQSWTGVWHSPGAEYGPEIGRSLGMSQPLVWDATKRSDGTPDATPNAFDGIHYFTNLGVIDQVSRTMFVADTGTGGRYEPIYFLNGFRDTWLVPTRVPVWATPWRYGRDSANYVWVDSHASSEKGDRMYPNPGKSVHLANWGAFTGNSYCAAARFQGTTVEMRRFFAGFATTRGVACTDF